MGMFRSRVSVASATALLLCSGACQDPPSCECRCVVDQVQVCGPAAATIKPGRPGAPDSNATRLAFDYEAASELQVAGEHRASLVFVEKVINADPSFRDIYFLRGFGLQSTGQLAEAVVSYERQLEQKPQDARSRFNLGHARMTLGNHAAAIRDFLKVLELQPERTAAHVHLATCYAAVGDAANAAKHRKLSQPQ